VRVLGVIPARGGSKSVPRKNIRLLAGLPLIAYTIRSASESKRLTRFLTSTDDQEIADVASKFGSPVLMRPSELGQDETPMPPVLLHALEEEEKQGRKYDVILLLQPTCPLRRGSEIDSALGHLEAEQADVVISVYQVSDAHPARMYYLRDNRLSPLAPQWEMTNRQALPPVYHRNGVIYAARVPVFRQKKTFYVHNTVPYVMPKESAVNIDDPLDLKFAEMMLKEFGLAHS